LVGAKEVTPRVVEGQKKNPTKPVREEGTELSAGGFVGTKLIDPGRDDRIARFTVYNLISFAQRLRVYGPIRVLFPAQVWSSRPKLQGDVAPVGHEQRAGQGPSYAMMINGREAAGGGYRRQC